MKLTAFEKNVFDKNAVQLPTVRTYSASQNDIKKITEDWTDPYLSSSSKAIIRQFDTDIEYVPFMRGGESFNAKMKRVSVTSGEPEIVHNTSQPQVTKKIDVSLKATADLRNIEDEEEENRQDFPQAEINFGSVDYNALINILLGTEAIEFYNSDSKPYFDLNTNERISAKRALQRFLRSNNSSLVMSEDNLSNLQSRGFYRTAYKSIARQTTLIPGMNGSYVYRKYYGNQFDDSRPYGYNDFLIPYRFVGSIRHIYASFQFCLKKLSELILPFYQTKEISERNITYLNTVATSDPNAGRGGDTRPINYPVSIANYAPINISASDFSIKTYSGTLSAGSRWATRQNRAGETEYYLERDNTVYFYYGIKLPSRYDKYFRDRRSAGENRVQRTVFYTYYTSGIRNERRYNEQERRSFVVEFDTSTVAVYGRSGNAGDVNDDESPSAVLERIKRQQADRISTSSLNNLANTLSGQARGFVGDYRQQETINNQVLNATPFKDPDLNLAKESLGITRRNIAINGKDFGEIELVVRNVQSGIPNNPFQIAQYLKINKDPINFRNIPLVSPHPGFPQFLMNGTGVSYNFVGLQSNSLAVTKQDERTQIRSKNNPDRIVNIRDRARPNRWDDFLTLLFNFSDIPDPIEVKRNGWSVPRPSFPGYPNARLFAIGDFLSRQFNPKFPLAIQHSLDTNRDKSQPDISDWLSYGGSIPTQARSLIVTILDQPLTAEEEEPEESVVNLLSSIDRGWPWVQVREIDYDRDSGRIILGLGRTRQAPIPPRNFFDSILLAGRSFESAKANYSQDIEDRIARWSWPASRNFIARGGRVPLILKKKGESVTNAMGESRIIRKSTIETNAYNDFPDVLGGFDVHDIGWTANSFFISFNGSISASLFSAIAIHSLDKKMQITRHLLANSAVRTEENGVTTFLWSDFPEFGALQDNKDYTIEMIKGGEKELDFFIPRPDKIHWNWPVKVALNKDRTELQIDWQSGGVQQSALDFISIALTKVSDSTKWLDWLSYDQWAKSSNADIDGIMVHNTKREGPALAELAEGDKLTLSVQAKARAEWNSHVIRTTDIVFDTIILLNTNLNDLFITDQVGNDLLHPSDILSIKSVTEDKLVHLMIELKNSIVSPQINLLNSRISKYDYRKIGQLYLLKKIGVFKQFPKIMVESSRSKEITLNQNNLSHVKSRPQSINYSMEFPAMLSTDDLILAQNLFSRVSDYDEFLIWVSGGEIGKDQGMRGFRFVDIIKSLISNEFDFSYIDGRFTSGVSFLMTLRQVE